MALGGLLVLCAGLLGFCLWLARRLREQAEQQQVQARGFEQRLRELNKRLDTYLTGSIRMGEELYVWSPTWPPSCWSAASVAV